eukprot:78919_1
MDDMDPNETNDEFIAMKQELMELRRWKDQIGVPAQIQQEQLLIEMELVKEQNRTIVSEITLYKQEAEKLKKDNHDLSEEADRFSTASRDARRIIKAKEQELSKLYEECQSLETALQQSQQQMDQMTRQSNEVHKLNEQYVQLMVNLQKEELSLKDKAHDDAAQLSELQAKYSTLDIQFHKQKVIVEESVQIADKLSSEVHDLEELQNTQNNDGQSGIRPMDKTMRFDPQSLATLRLANSTMHGDKWYDNNDTMRDTRELDHLDGDSMRELDEVIKNLKDEMQSEFDEKMEKERDELSETYLLQISQMHDQIVEYKQKIGLQSDQLKNCHCSTENGSNITNNERSRFNEPNTYPCTGFIGGFFNNLCVRDPSSMQ